MQHLVLTVIGADKTGLVKALSETLNQNEANWLASNLSHLSGYFAGVIEVAVVEANIQKLTQDLANIEGLTISIHRSNDVEVLSQQELEFVITGNDRRGIVQELSSVISHKGANIMSFVSTHQSAPNWGGELFHAVAKVVLPPGMSPDVIVDALEQIATDIIVDIELEKAS
ncbi:glycine cleavage system transcriptional repressor [Psychrosphaera aestuarii]|uniref:glycine cleavage system protein R n=1 Tax=Psychrosphaera aestuarii TaxID=1266052 RepID=UPI001B344597|nr:ACT domain-containing protein [Psychrosphaera aestuarii]